MLHLYFMNCGKSSYVLVRYEDPQDYYELEPGVTLLAASRYSVFSFFFFNVNFAKGFTKSFYFDDCGIGCRNRRSF